MYVWNSDLQNLSTNWISFKFDLFLKRVSCEHQINTNAGTNDLVYLYVYLKMQQDPIKDPSIATSWILGR